MDVVLITGEKPDEEPNPSQHPAFRARYPQLFAPLQTEGYRRVSEGRSCALVAPTSSGKTLAVAAPLFEARRPAVFVLPFRALIADQSQELPRIAKMFDIASDRFAKLQGGTPDKELVEALKADYLLMTPDKLVSLFIAGRKGNAAALNILSKHHDYVFDEVHIYNALMRTSLLYFLRSVRFWQESHQRQSGFYFLSATFPPETWQMLQRELGLTDADRIEGKSFTGNVQLTIKPRQTVTRAPTGEIPIVEDLKALDMETNVVGIFNSAYRAYQISEALPRGLLFIGQDKLSELKRQRNFDEFMNFPDERALIGSPAIEAGVDFEAHNLVIEESNQDSFVQRFGRAARSGRDARVLAYSDTLHQMQKEGQLALTYTRADFLALLRDRIRRNEPKEIFTGLAAYPFYPFWKTDDFPLEPGHRQLCEQLKAKGVDSLLAFRGLVPYTHYESGESIGYKTLFRKNLKIDPKTRRVKGYPDPDFYYKTPRRPPVLARLKKTDIAKSEKAGDSLILLAKVAFELVYGHFWTEWVLLEISKKPEWDVEDDNIAFEYDGEPYQPDGRPGNMLVRFYGFDV